MTTRVTLQPAFVLHRRPYSDTSLLVELLTWQYGRFTVLARGARAMNSKLRNIVIPFAPLLVSWVGKTDLPILQSVEANGIAYQLIDRSLLSSFYLNELLMRLLHRHDSHPKIFAIYEKALMDLATSNNPEIPLRIFEKYFLIELGYGIQFDCTVDNAKITADKNYSFEYGHGFSLVPNELAIEQGVFSGKCLLAIHENIFPSPEELRVAKQIFRTVIRNLLGNQPLKSADLFR